MPVRTAYDPGTPCWVDLIAPDVEAAKTFYAGLFGWDVVDEYDDDGTHTYTNFTKGEKVVAGLSQQPPELAGAPPIWATYVATDDIEATTAAVTAAGGDVVMPPLQVFDQGCLAVYRDPTGAMISVWQAGAHFGAQVCNEPGTWAWNELRTRDLDAALGFYGTAFAWDFDAMAMEGLPSYHVVTGGQDAGRAGLMAMPGDMPAQVPNHWAVYFMVADSDAMVGRVEYLGGQIVMGPHETPVGTLTGVHDPANGNFMLMEPPSK